MTKRFLFLTATAILAACAPSYAHAKPKAVASAAAQIDQSAACITEKEVVAAQKAWGEGIVKIGQA